MHIPGIRVVPTDRASRHNHGQPFTTFPRKVSFTPTEGRSAPTSRTSSLASSVARNESFSSAGSGVVRSVLRPYTQARVTSSASLRSASSSTSSARQHESFSSAGSDFVRSALRPSLQTRARSASSRSDSSSTSSARQHESFSSAGSDFVRSALRPSLLTRARSASSRSASSSSTSSSVHRNESFSSAGSDFVRSALRSSNRTVARSASSSSVSSSSSTSSSSSSSSSSYTRTSVRDISVVSRSAAFRAPSLRSDSSSSFVISPVCSSTPSLRSDTSSSFVISPVSSRTPSLCSDSSSSFVIAPVRTPSLASSVSSFKSVVSSQRDGSSRTSSVVGSSRGSIRSYAQAARARLNEKHPGHFPGSSRPAVGLRSAMKKPGSCKSKKRVQFSGEEVKEVDRWIIRGVDTFLDPSHVVYSSIRQPGSESLGLKVRFEEEASVQEVDRWIVPGVDTYRDHSGSLLGKLSGWKVVQLSTPNEDGEMEKYVEFWGTSANQLSSHTDVPCGRNCAYCEVGRVRKELNRACGYPENNGRDVSSKRVFSVWNKRRENLRERRWAV